MPDQSSAATEHAILQEITAPLDHLPDDPVALVHADFPVALRGYDRMAVDAYVQRTSQLVAELQATRSPEAAVRRALERVGEQISGILQRAHETAEQITAQSRREAEDRLVQARAEAADIAAAAQQRVRDLDADTDRIWSERHRIVDDTRDLSSQLLALADAAADRFPGDVEEPGPPAPPFDAAALRSETTIAQATEDEDTTGDYFEGEDTTGDYFEDGEPVPDAEAEHLAAHEEDDEVLDEDPGLADDDVEATRAFSALDLQTHQEPPPSSESGPAPEDVIPPSSPAAHRRTGE